MSTKRPLVEASWLFLVEPLLLEPISTEMDRRMLMGLKARASASPA